MNCEGNCIETHGGHRGEVKPVQVWVMGFKWDFNYCENAIEEDRSRGIEVTAKPISIPVFGEDELKAITETFNVDEGIE